MIRKFREARAQIGGNAIFNIDGVQSIDTDQQHVVDAPVCAIVAQRGRCGWQ